MGFLTSLLCCSTDTKDDANDKVQSVSTEHRQQQKQQQQQQPLSKSQQSRLNQQNSNPIDDTSNTNQSAKKLDTRSSRNIRNSNNNSGETDRQNVAEEIDKSKNENTKSDISIIENDDESQDENNPCNIETSKKDSLDVGNNSVNETDTMTNTNEESINNTPKTLSDANNAPSSNDLIANGQEQNDSDDESEESYLDLAKLQEGQAHNSESGFLLPRKDPKFGKKKCLVLDLDETLVHSSFKYLRTADFVIPVEIDGQIHHVYVIKRPGVDEFLRKVGEWYEVVVFTASVEKYGHPLLDKLDLYKSVHHRLFREACYNYQGNYIKNLSQIGRDLADLIIIDNSPTSYIFHPQHSIPISSWFSDTHDNELLDLLPFLEDLSKSTVDSIPLVLDINI